MGTKSKRRISATHVVTSGNIKVRAALRTARVKCLAVVWALSAALCDNTGAVAAQKAVAEKPPIPAPKQSPAMSPDARGASSANFAAGEEGGSEGTGDARGAAVGLPIPRFVSLRTNPINLRTGPGVRYPVDWVYVRRSLPVEVIGEFDTWRHIRDPDGAEGWVHQSMLSGKRTAIVKGAARTLKRAGEDAAETIATLDIGVVVNVQRCPAESSYCRVEVSGLQGWLKRDQFWGVYPSEALQ